MNKSSIRAPSLWRWWPCLWKRRVLGEGRNYLRLAAHRQGDRNGNLVASIEEMDSRYGPDQFLHLAKTIVRGNRIFLERRTTMRNDMRPELSQKNPYWIGKHRYYELKHFCLQYPIWKKADWPWMG